jgi:POT family proton-dependent oligopeptide transporter
MIPEPSEGTPASATNGAYGRLFAELGIGSVVVGVALVALIPFLRKLIKDEEAPRVDAAVASDAATT